MKKPSFFFMNRTGLHGERNDFFVFFMTCRGVSILAGMEYCFCTIFMYGEKVQNFLESFFIFWNLFRLSFYENFLLL